MDTGAGMPLTTATNVSNFPAMRIATWNLERGGRTKAARAAQQAVLASNDIRAADVLVLTEPPAAVEAGPGTVRSPPGCHGSWVALQGRNVQPLDLQIPYDRMAVAARVSTNGGQIIVYGAVLPWTAVKRHAPDLVRADEDSFGAFKRALEEQASDIVALRKLGDPVVWVGDFNQSVEGANFGGSRPRRDLLKDTLKSLNMAAWNGSADHAKPGMCSIDLICGPKQQTVTASGRIDPIAGGVTMSDHAGYWIDIL